MNGLLGLNVRTLGVSRDTIVSAVRQLNCVFVLVMDDPELVAQLSAIGVRVIYRQSNDETLSISPDAFVAERHKNAPSAAFIALTNELDPTKELLDWTRKAIDYATPRGIKLCIFNFATDRSLAQWQAATSLVQYAVARSHAIGVHVYQRQAESAQSYHWLDLKRAVGGLWLVTEYAWYIDSYHGWRGKLSPPQYGQFLDATLPLFEREHMPALLFSGDNWPLNNEGRASGFGVLDNADALKEIQRVNQSFTWSDKPVNPPPVIQIPAPTTGGTQRIITGFPPAIDYRNIRTQPNKDAPDIGNLMIGDTVTAYLDSPSDGWVYLQYLQVPTAGWVLFTGVEHKPYGTPLPPPAAFTLQYPVAPPVRVSQAFGVNHTGIADFYTRWGLPAHEGIDFGGNSGDPIYAAADGIIKAINIPGKGGVVADHAYGIHIKATHTGPDGRAYETDYCHLSNIVAPLTVKQVVKAGQQIGYMGHTGNANGENHLHWMCRKAGNTAAGIKQRLGNGAMALYSNDIVDPTPFLSI